MHDERVEVVLSFWFGPDHAGGSVPPEISSRWWTKSEEFDEEIRRRFGALYEEAVAGELNAWSAHASSALAQVIVLDQFSRNMFRDSPAMYGSDEQALRLAVSAIEVGHDRQLPPSWVAFLYMPLMHAENLEMQERCVELFRRLVEDEGHSSMRNNLEFAIRHRDVVKQFGRFPHRNEILEREATEAEAAYLASGGESF